MKVSDHEDLFKRYQSGEVSPEERVIVEDYILNNRFNELRLSEEELEAITARLAQRIGRIADGERQAVPLYRRWRGIAVVAAAVGAIAIGVYFFNANRHANTPPRNEFGAGSQDIAPGKNGATITLANGKVIALSDAKSGVIVGGGKLAYYPSLRGGTTKQSPLHDEIASIPRNDGEGKQQITASTAKGQTYRFTLPDGTKVWLNADSKLEFPSSFVNSKTRNVKLSGEGYFEVAKDKAHPFIVETKRQQIEVLGTHFNVSAYANDVAMKTTLFEGKVAVTEDGSRLTLDPGDQAYSGLDGVRAKTLMNPEAEIDWKNGDFIFRNEALESIMSRVARWYNIEVVYAPGVDRMQSFSGSVSRSKPVSAILGIIQLTKQVKFKIEGRKVYVQ
ncbi:FecR family protein [Pedobacter ginsengisoli]|uniref:FecR family protein n=1 Tax=Pedobacter ginsengisoli TaxID=363852 RepID=UPI002549C91D|nr:FecR family protein [Pedobacter ginsengisoli]